MLRTKPEGVTFPALPELFDPIAWWATVHGDRTAVIDATTGAHTSYRALHREADAWHTLLAAHGVSPGDRVAILAQNRVEFIPLFFGCLRLGAVLVPLNWRLSAPELSRVLAHAEPSLLLGEDAFRGLAEQAVVEGKARIGWYDLDRDIPSRLESARQDATPPSPPRTYDDCAMLLYTSGSTGAPKGVMVPHRQLLWNALATTTAWELGAADVGLVATPLFHTGGWHVFLTTLLSRGGTVVVLGAFDAERYMDALHRYRVTMSFGVPTQLDLLQRATQWGRPLPSLRTFIAGGAPCPPRTRDAVRAAGYRLREAYGLTECGPNCFATNEQTALDKEGTVGWPVPFLQMRLRDADGLVVSPDHIGELELRGPQLFSGYYRDPQGTADALTSDGWLRTGDLASADAEGVYRICGRRREMFISGGENVFPGEVEAALLECPNVLEVCVVGVADTRWGEVGCAVIVPQHGARDMEASLLLQQVRVRLAGYKVPKRVLFVDHLPKLGSGKIDRAAVAAKVGTIVS